MKGSPLLRALIAFVLIALAGLPLWKLTRTRSVIEDMVRADEVSSPVQLRLTFSVPPRSFAISHLGRIVWANGADGTEAEKTLALVFPKEGIDLAVKVAWPGEADAAVRLRLTDPGGNEHDKTVWGRGEMDEVITFP